MKSIKALFGIFMVVAGFYLAWKLLPPYFNHYQFEDIVAVEARTAAYSHPPKTEDEIRNTVYKKAQEMDLPITPQQIKVRRAESGVEIDVNYTVHVELPVRPLDLDFSVSSKNKRI
jgi:hypothetical protein